MGVHRRNRERPLLARLKRLVVPGLLGVAGYYAVFGGEYSWFELRSARASVVEEQVRLEEARAEIDSLRAIADLLENDSATIETIAREEFGMVREGETLYRLAEPEGEPRVPEPAR